MKPMKFLPVVLIAAAGLVASCSTSKLAQTNASDDVYNTVAKAKEVEYRAPAVAQQAQVDYDDEYYGTSNPYYDMDYSSRINRFYNGSSWRGYYDPYFDNYYYGNSYGNSNYLGYGLGWNSGYGLGGWGGYYGSIWNNPFYYGNLGYGWNSPYYGWNSWGPNSYYDRYGWGGGYYGGGWGYGGGYYGGSFGSFTNRNNRARPNRDGENRGAYGNNGTSFAPNSNNGRPIATSNNAGRPERWSNGNNNGSNVNGQAGRVSSRPSRDDSFRPQTQQTQPASRPDRGSYSPPPSQSSGGNSSGGGSSSGGGGGGGRPTRGGGR
jgi:hypothetical protein